MNKTSKNIRNQIDFWLRSHIRLSRGNYYPTNESKDDLFKDNNTIAEKEEQYLNAYHLQRLKDHSKKRIYLENLSIIELLESCLTLEESDKTINVLDIGSKNWFYVEGEYNFFKYNSFEKEISLTGIEVDAHRLYTDFHTRHDYASYYIKNLDNAKYIAGDLMQHQGKYDYITWFFPFVTEYPLLIWGLPLNLFKPQPMLKHAYSLLKPEGKMIIVNHGKEESLLQEELLKKLNIPYSQKGPFDSTFIKFEVDKYITVIQ